VALDLAMKLWQLGLTSIKFKKNVIGIKN
jgi:uncharacterized protein YhbP (UPF0306 family)